MGVGGAGLMYGDLWGLEHQWVSKIRRSLSWFITIGHKG
ncbi:hypothetical protein FB565_002025 [Actinoplanes lutulentus]|uniref:Uncharacterized protein n=1 Tax=Actinoplanes lutulentus TaxID=1287878 RepID=A0A327Z6Y2_9ACTN|nr:hypothetical protein [Actinoplanes lutulentus]RAK33082.1 hypothetical protein B0I29_112114 [Actinoplanes lutulentus]